MAIQLTWDTFSTIKPHNDSDTSVIVIAPQVPTSTAPGITAARPLAEAERSELATGDIALPDVSRFEEFRDMRSLTIYGEDQPETHRLPDITFEIEGNPNELLWKAVIDSTPKAFDRTYILDTYKTLGQTVKIEGDRGLADMARRREANYAQFFTPKEIVRFITAALGLDKTDKKPIVVDNSCGIGKMFQFLSPSCLKTGIELEEQAYHMAARLWPDAHIVHDSLINHTKTEGDYFLINPPFSMQLEQKNIPLENACWGELGPNSSIQSHIAALEIAISNADKYVAAVLPMGYFTNENTYTFEKWVNARAELVLRVDMPAEVWKDAGTAWPCSVVIYRTRFSHYNRKDPFVRTITKLSDLNTVLDEWRKTGFYNDALDSLRTTDEFPVHVRPAVKKAQQIVFAKPTLPFPSEVAAGVKIALAPDSSSLVIRSSNLLEALKVQQYMDGMGRQWNDGLKEYTQESDVKLRRKYILRNPDFIENIHSDLRTANLHATVDPQVKKWLTKKQRWLERQLTPFEQYIKKDGEWACLNEHSGIRSMYPKLYKAGERRLKALGIDWLWGFQKDDVIRMGMKNTNLLANSMGLGKTRCIVALALLYGCKHNLIIVEPKLKDEFIKEFRELNITDYQCIESEKDLKLLKKFNLIAYNKLWKPLNEHTKKTFAKAMRRRFQFIAVDEAHKIKAKDSEQAKSVRMLKARYKLLSTGTPIANYPRNIFSLLVFGWGDGTELNPYGYYNPIEQTSECGYTSGYTTGTRQFKEDFITIEWVTPQFEQTLDKGMKSREMPKIKDTAKWWAMMSPKIIRRQKEEPEVATFVTIPKPEISTELIKMSPQQVKHYKHWLDDFAAWFKEQLRLEKESPEGHKIDQMVVLAHLTQLQFASTIPQSKKTNNEHCLWQGGVTTKQERTLDLIKEALSKEEKIIVFSERPDFQRLMQQELKTRGIKSNVFIGSQGIKNRNVVLNDFKNNGTNVLLATTTCGETGLNIPQANVVIIADTSWTPSKQIQAYSRILRPQQTRKPRIYLLRAKGTIDEYMQQLMDAKSEAIDEGIDYQDAGEFDPAKWLSYRDFTIRMLEEEGYNMG